MSVGLHSDLKIYDEQFYGGMVESLTQNTEAFNTKSGGAIVLVPKEMKGNYAKESFFKSMTDLITRRDLTSVSAATAIAMVMDEMISVKCYRKIGPVDQTLGSLRNALGSTDNAEMSFILGKMIGEHTAQGYLNAALIAAETAIEAVAGANYDNTGNSTKTLTHAALASGLAKFGDKAGDIVTWVMHSKPANDLLAAQVASSVDSVIGAAIYQGAIGTLNRPVLVTDSAALIDLNGSATDTYSVLGLVRGAVVVTESERAIVENQIVTGLEQLVLRTHGEFAFNLGVKGYKWDTSNGGANPTDATLAITTNWDVAGNAGVKGAAGIRIKVQ